MLFFKSMIGRCDRADANQRGAGQQCRTLSKRSK